MDSRLLLLLLLLLLHGWFFWPQNLTEKPNRKSANVVKGENEIRRQYSIYRIYILGPPDYIIEVNWKVDTRSTCRPVSTMSKWQATQRQRETMANLCSFFSPPFCITTARYTHHMQSIVRACGDVVYTFVSIIFYFIFYVFVPLPWCNAIHGQYTDARIELEVHTYLVWAVESCIMLL